MGKKKTLTEAFAAFGASTHNVRQAWSAVSSDGETVVLTIWQHKRMDDGSVDYFDPQNRSRWEQRWGNQQRKLHIQHAIDRCSSRFKVIWVVAVDKNADPKRIKDRIADPETVMRIERFDKATGEFAARPV